MSWDDLAGAASNDYDLILLDCATRGLLDISTGVQQGNDEPSERVSFRNHSTAPVDVCYTIQNYLDAAAPRMLDVTIEGAVVAHAFNAPGRSLVVPADAHGDWLVVGAVSVTSPDQVEAFSSFGPTFDGRSRPDVVATDGVSVSGAGGHSPTFGGTAAAAAHAGGLASLLLELEPGLTRSGLKALLMETATPLGDLNVSGAGRIDPVASAQRARPAKPIANLTITGDKGAPQPVGTTVHFTAEATGGTQPYSCRWWVYDGTGWTMVRDWGACTYAWTPGSTNPSYAVGVWMRSAGLTGDATEATGAVAFAVSQSAPLVLTTITGDKGAPQPVGTTVHFTAEATGGTQPYSCRWWAYDGRGWTMVRDWGVCTYAWTPGSANPSYAVGVWMRSAGLTGDTTETTGAVAFPVR